jgi:DNA-binding GntR family transcriptional regulator
MRDRASDTVFLALRDAILTGALPESSEHSIYEFAERFGVSRTPVREAVLRLADLGMVEIRRNRGVRIRGLSAVEVRAIFELRLLLEVPAAIAAAQLRSPVTVAGLREALGAMATAADSDDIAGFALWDRALHDAIIGALDNQRLLDVVSDLRDATQAMGASTMNRARRLAEIEEEHEPIVEAIERGDVRAAERTMRDHLVNTGRTLLQQVDPSGTVGWRMQED